MRKLIIWIIVLVFALSMTLISISCKEEAAVETEEEAAVETEEEAAEAAREPVTLVFWAPWATNDPSVALWEAISKQMQEKYNITVILEPQGYDTWNEVKAASMLSKSGPDLIFGWAGASASITDGISGILEPLNDLLPEGMEEKVAGWSGVTDADGNIYSVVLDVAICPIAFNKDLFDEAGVDYSDSPKIWYWDEFLDVCKKLKDAGITPLAFANKEGQYSQWFIPSSATSCYFDSNEDVADYFANKSLNSQPFLNMVQQMKDLYDKGYFVEGGTTMDWDNNSVQQFTGGQVAMHYSYVSFYRRFQEALGKDKIGVNFWPYGSDEGELSKTVNNVAANVIGIASWSEHKEEAMLVIQEVTATEWGANLLVEYTEQTPPLIGYQATYSDPGWNEFQKKAAEIINENNGALGFMPSNWCSKETIQAIGKFGNQVLTGEMSIEDYAKEIDKANGR